jgi:hypothetical protein
MPLLARDAATRITGSERLVLVDAPAGHGKTHEAVEAVGVLGRGLDRGQQALLLSHTNAARDEIRLRFGPSVEARAQTLDSLACDIVTTYASRLGITLPLRPGAEHLGQPTFEAIRRMACEVLRDAPIVARGLAWRYPAIVVDEHQDSSIDQHELVWRIHQAGSGRLRLFGDQLQAIFSFGGSLIDWTDMVAEHGAVELTHGYRWDAQPELRDWLARARRALLRGEAIDCRDRPTCVHVHRWSGRAPGPKQQGHCPACVSVLRQLSVPRRAAYLVRNREHAYGLAIRLRGVAKLYEGGDVQEPLEVLQRLDAASGDPRELALLLTEVLRRWGTGLTKDLHDQLGRACRQDGIDLRRRSRLRPLAAICEPLYASPTVAGFLRAFTLAVAQRDQIGWRPVRRDATYLLLSIPSDCEDPILALSALAQQQRTRRGPLTKIMTVHRAKGREFEAVVLPYVSNTTFPADGEGLRLAYVALTRAQAEIHVLVPSEAPSDLFLI